MFDHSLVRRLFNFILVPMLLSCEEPAFKLLGKKTLPDYPSASGIEYYKGKFYIIGDDASTVWIGSDSLEQTGHIQLDSSTGKRIPKDIKPDLEAAAMVWDGREPRLLLLGSGSVSPYRNIAWLIDPATREKREWRLDSFYRRLIPAGLKSVNIEGAASIPGYVILANRGNKSYPRNYLVLTGPEFWKEPDSASIRLIKTGSNTDTASFQGISGIAYANKSDRLLLTVSTENTYNSIEDGIIGKSYIWIIRDISLKKRFTAINPTEIIDLEATAPEFKGHKIESICVVSESDSRLELVLVADDDKGSSTLFRIELKNR